MKHLHKIVRTAAALLVSGLFFTSAAYAAKAVPELSTLGSSPSVSDASESVDILPDYSSAFFPQDSIGGQETARLFVTTSQLYKGLSLLLLDEAKTSADVTAAIKRRGFNQVKTDIVAKIKLITAKYRMDWEDMLSRKYAAEFSAEKLQSIMQKRDASPHFSEFITYQKMQGKRHILRDHPLFQAARAELLSTYSTDSDTLASVTPAASVR